MLWCVCQVSGACDTAASQENQNNTGSEAWHITLENKHKLQVSGNKVIINIFVPKRTVVGRPVIMGSFTTVCLRTNEYSNKGMEFNDGRTQVKPYWEHHTL